MHLASLRRAASASCGGWDRAPCERSERTVQHSPTRPLVECSASHGRLLRSEPRDRAAGKAPASRPLASGPATWEVVRAELAKRARTEGVTRGARAPRSSPLRGRFRTFGAKNAGS